MSHAILVLHSSNVGQAVQSGNTERCFSLLSAKKIEPLRVDGSDEAQLAQRNKLFGVSGIRGNYPQVSEGEEGRGEEGRAGAQDEDNEDLLP